MMRAAVLTSLGVQPPHACFTYKADYPKPTLPSQDWVLVRVRRAGLNRAELRGRNNEAGALPEFPPIFQSEYHKDPPEILGEEFVGEVEHAGSQANSQKGERVAGLYLGGGKAHNGSYADFTITRKEYVFRLPGPDELQLGDEEGQRSWSDVATIPGTG